MPFQVNGNLNPSRVNANNNGSSRISVRSAELSKYAKRKVDEIPVTESRSYHRPQGAIKTLDKAVGSSFDEVIEHFLPPIAQGCDEIGEVLVAGETDFEHPSREKPGGFLFAVNLLEDAAEFLFEQIQNSKFRLTSKVAIPSNSVRVSSATSLKSSMQIRFTALAASFTNGITYSNSFMGKPPG
jgi:hypothetical protein